MASSIYYYDNSQPPYAAHTNNYQYTPTNQEDGQPHSYYDTTLTESNLPPVQSPGESTVYELRDGTTVAHVQNDDWANKGPGYDSLLITPGDTLVAEGPWNNTGDGKLPKRTRSWGGQFGLWIWEILACLVSLCALAAVIGVLVYEDGKPLDKWAWVIGPTAVVSFISTVAKSSMLLAVSEIIGQIKWQHFDGKTNALVDLQVFDDAGRGPWGATKFLLKKNIKSLLASLASIIVIMALLVDPFMQLVFNFPALSREDLNEVALFNRTEIYDPNGYIFDVHMTSSVASAVDARMQAAIIRAVSDSSSSPSAACSTGNCTWDGVTTLGVCASCTNITDRISNLSGFMFSAGATGDFFPTRWNSSATALDPTSGNASSPARLAHVEAVQLNANFDYGTQNLSSVLRQPTAWQCEFAFCARTYENVTMTNGRAGTSSPPEDVMLETGNITNASTPVGGGVSGLSFFRGLRTNSSAGSSPDEEYRINVADYSNLANYLAEIFSSGLMLVVFMLLKTKREEHLPVWKNSSLAMLAHRVEGWGPRAERASQGPSGLEREARDVPVTLSRNPDELVFVRG
ncbi:hypothetical protein F5X99DRAFT_409059 [Biscogniauxia marginata]|nr:hypothetical protein F5X99DRAFT_409059 [Biscogniauxia marginata]